MFQKKSFKLLLTLGLCFFVAFSAVACRKGHSPEAMADKIVEKISDELDLDDTQLADLNVIRDEALAKFKEYRSGHKEIKAEVLTQMKNDQIDTAKIKEMINAQHAKKEEAVSYFVDRLADFYVTLNDDQKQKVIEHMEEGPRSCFFGGHHQGFMSE